MSETQLLADLWQQYIECNPEVKKIHGLFAKNNKVINDHIALRTIDDSRVDIEFLAQPFIRRGYCQGGEYHFPVKKLYAKHYQHPDPERPKIFISQLRINELSISTSQGIQSILNQIPTALLEQPDKLLLSGVSWIPSYHLYQQLLAESEYAAWFYAFGFRANHFTVLVNALTQFSEISQVNAFLKQNGYLLNASGGEIKGSPYDLLEQSSTKASSVEVQFTEGVYNIPGCYYEFAKRYPDSSGQLYQGFVAASADKIFESTDVKG